MKLKWLENCFINLLLQAYEPNNHCQQNASVLKASRGKLVLLAVTFKLLYLNNK